MARQPSTSAVQSALMPRVSDHLVKSAIRLVRQSTTVPNTSDTRAFTADTSDMALSHFYFRHSGMRLGAQARNPYSRWWLWIPGSLVSLAPRHGGGTAGAGVATAFVWARGGRGR